MSQLAFVLVNDATAASPLASQVTPAWLAQVAQACAVQLNRDVSPSWGGSYEVTTDLATQIAPGEIVFAIVDALPDAPGAIAYHDVDGNAAPVAYLALSACRSLDDVSVAISHELCETAGDPDCNLWADDGAGTEWARELCDAVEASSYLLNGIRVSDFVLPAFFETHAPGPYSYTESVGGPRLLHAPFDTASGGYQIKRSAGTGETQVQGMVPAHRLAKAGHPSSRVARRMRRWLPDAPTRPDLGQA